MWDPNRMLMTYFCIALLQHDVNALGVCMESSEPSIFNAFKCKSMVLSCMRLKTQPMSSPSIRLIAGKSWLLQIPWTKNQNATSLGPTTLRESDQKQGGLLGYSFDNSISLCRTVHNKNSKFFPVQSGIHLIRLQAHRRCSKICMQDLYKRLAPRLWRNAC